MTYDDITDIQFEDRYHGKIFFASAAGTYWFQPRGGMIGEPEKKQTEFVPAPIKAPNILPVPVTAPDGIPVTAPAVPIPQPVEIP
jgi:hypothetical protein